jgi:hypothetical protein
MDRLLTTVRDNAKQGRRRTMINTPLRKSIAVRTFGDWHDTDWNRKGSTLIEGVDVRRGTRHYTPGVDPPRCRQAGYFFFGVKSACRDLRNDLAWWEGDQQICDYSNIM